jgi:enoyl-CoA hydratase/carnithine racemase
MTHDTMTHDTMTHNAVLLRTDAGAELTAIAADATERKAALASARKIAAKSAHVVKIGKAAFYRQLENGPRQGAYEYTAEVMVENMMARDAQEGICAFVEKRAPTWEDR